MEIMIIKLCDSRLSTSPESLLERISALESGVSNIPQTKPSQKTQIKPDKKIEKPDISDVPFIPDEPKPTPSEPKPTIIEQPVQKPQSSQNQMIAFGDILEQVREKSPMLYSMIVDSSAYLDGDTVTLKVPSMGYFMITSDKNHFDLLESVASKILGYKVCLKLEVLDQNAPSSDKVDLSDF